MKGHYQNIIMVYKLNFLVHSSYIYNSDIDHYTALYFLYFNQIIIVMLEMKYLEST